MIKDIKNHIEQKMQELPLYLQEAIRESGWEKKIFDIGRKYNLQIDDLEYLQVELSASLVGISDQYSFSEAIKDNLNLSDEVVDKIVEDINNQIFSGIRDKLKEEVLEKENEDEKINTEPKTIKIAGVTMGDNLDDDNEEITENEIKKDTQPDEEIVPIKEEKTVTEEKPVSVDSSKPVSGVFQTQTKTISSENNKNLDPYREPIE